MIKTKTPTFLGLTDEDSRYEDARFAVVSVPFEATTSYAKGTDRGPEAIIAASAQVELYDEEVGLEPFRLGVATLPALDFRGKNIETSMRLIEKEVAQVTKDGKIPIVLGGEHSITPPAVRGVAEVHPELTVVQLDAHADLRQSYEGTPYSHACAMARVREKFPVVQIGIRSLSIEEAKWIEKDHLPVFFAHTLEGKEWMDEAIAAVKTEKVYLTIDIDALDSSVMPHTGTPEPGGLTFRQLTTFVQKLMQKKNVVAFDVVELMPQPHGHAADFLVARLISKCMGYWKKGQRS